MHFATTVHVGSAAIVGVELLVLMGTCLGRLETEGVVKGRMRLAGTEEIAATCWGSVAKFIRGDDVVLKFTRL